MNKQWVINKLIENERRREQVLASDDSTVTLQELEEEYLALLLRSGELWAELQNTTEFRRAIARGETRASIK